MNTLSHEPEQSPARQGDSNEPQLSAAELRGWMEFGCWTTLALAPFLYWVNGPAVSQDQFVVRSTLVTVAAVGAVGLRWYAWRRPRHIK